MKTNFTPSRIARHLFFMMLFALTCLNLSAITYTITVQSFVFTPDSVNANVGDTIVWQWVNGTHTTTSTSVPGAAATWNSPISSSSTSFSYVITQPGTYRYHCAIHSSMTGVIIASGTAPVEKTDASPAILVYPRPFTGKLIVNLNSNAVFTTNVTVEVYDILGARKYQRHLGDDVNEPLTMDLSDLPQGVYFVVLNNGKDKATFKVTKL